MHNTITDPNYKTPAHMDQYNEMLEFERLVREFTHSFSESLSGGVESFLSAALGHIAGFFNFDTLAQLHIYEHLVVREGIWRGPHLLHTNDKFAAFECPWAICELAQGNMIRVTDLETLPSNAGIDRTFCRLFGIRSLYGIPLSGKQGIVGALVLGTSQPERHLLPESIRRVQVLGEILTQGVLHAERKRTA